MGVFDPGGGGGPFRGLTEAEICAVDKPFDLFGEFTPKTADEINMMFDILFKCATRAENELAALKAAPAGAFLLSTVELTSAEILVLNTTPITVIKGVPGKIITPLFRVIESDTTGTASPGTSWQTVYNALTSNLLFVAQGTDFNNIRQKFYTTANVTDLSTDTSIVGSSVQIQLSGDPSGGTHFATVRHWYAVITPKSIV